jgi:transcriptional regulator with XRE-family HTH domain
MKDLIKKKLALKVKALREASSLTQEELADKCGVSWRTISNLERGLVIPDLCTLCQMSQIFQVGLDDMLETPIDEHKSRSRLEREQFLIEKIKISNDKVLNFLLDQLIFLFKYFG